MTPVVLFNLSVSFSVPFSAVATVKMFGQVWVT